MGTRHSGNLLVMVQLNSLVDQMVKNLPAMQETWFDPWVRKIPLEKGMATHSSILS